MKTDKIMLDHGSGGKMAHQMIKNLLLPEFDNPILARMDDSAVFSAEGGRWAFSTDSYTVDPIFFPGGDIGDLAVNGTVNDVAMSGARPRYLSLALIIEEGLPVTDFEKILKSIGTAARTAEVSIVTGDTKVVPKGAADKIFINTAGIGVVPEGIDISGYNARPGDVVLLSGTIADHGITVLTQREGLSFASDVASDTAPLNHLIQRMLAVCPEIHVLRDPTRGGLGTTLNEIAEQSRLGVKIYEEKIPVRPSVAGVCELLGFDPLYLANEGKLVAFVPGEHAGAVLEVMQADDLGREACVIGEAVEESPGKVFMQTRIGGMRIVDMLTGEQLPRIC